MAQLEDQPLSSSEASTSLSGGSDTQSSFTSPSPDLARVFVRLSNGTTIVVPLPQNSTVHDLHTRALQRSQRLGLIGTLEDTVLETIGNNTALVFGDDALANVLDLTEDNTFSMRRVENTTTLVGVSQNQGVGTSQEQVLISEPASREPATASAPEDFTVYVRWITLELAMENSQLLSVPIDNAPFHSNTTLSDLYEAALKRFCSSQAGSHRDACNNVKKLALFLEECRLHTEDNFTTLGSLVSEASKHSPINIFVGFMGERPLFHTQSLLSSEPKSTWSFNSTKHGISTFITSLQILLKEIEQSRCSLDGILEVLLGLTHFPPLLLAFRSLHETGIENGISTEPLLLVASAFHAICLKMVPAKFCTSPDTALEASRQVVYWVYSLDSEASLTRDSNKLLVHRARVTTSESFPPFKPSEKVEVPMRIETRSEKTLFLVSVEIGDKALCERLGVALNKKASLPWDFYFQAAANSHDPWNHIIRPTLTTNDWDRLIEVTNKMDAFKMVGPLQLGSCLAAQLPVITMSATGYVSKYEHEDLECSERSFITWNAIEGRVKLPPNPGQFLSLRIDPILTERKKLPSWELDAWPEWTRTADFGTPDEAIVICVDISSSMNCTMPDGWIPNRSTEGTNPSRLTEVKEFFKNLSLRISALNLSTHLGLVTFSQSTVTKQPLTPLHLNFNHQLDNIDALGSTAIFDGIDRAYRMLSALKLQYPNARRRIILLTDGEDNVSYTLPSAIARQLHDDSIILDAVVIGTSKTCQLFKIARTTGGYAFWPQTQSALFQIFLLETMVDIRARPELLVLGKDNFTDWQTFKPKEPDMKDPYDFPPCRPHPNLDDYFIALADAELFMNRLSRHSSSGTPRRTSATASTLSSSLSSATRLSAASTVTQGSISRILLSEIKAMIEHPHEFLDVYVSQSNMGFWKVVLQGPPDSPYAKGSWLLYVEIGEEFPRRPPTARFVTPVLHPNITKHGRVCHPIFDREWTPNTRVYQVLQQLYGILMSLEARDAIDPLSALRFWSDEEEGKKEVEKYVEHFASRTRAEHRSEIIVPDNVSSSASSITSTSTSSASGPQPGPQYPSFSPYTARTRIEDRVISSNGSTPTPSTSGATITSSSGLVEYLNSQRVPGNSSSIQNGGVGSAASEHSGSTRRSGRRSSFFDRLRGIRG